jgi:hypothetical protein
MYKHSYRAEGPWQGEFDHPQQALDAGRAMYGDVSRVYVGVLEPAYFSDMFIGSRAFVSYMQEESEKFGDQFVQSFEVLPPALVNLLGKFVKGAIEEWEAELPEEFTFKGEVVKKFKGYTVSAMVRPVDFK